MLNISFLSLLNITFFIPFLSGILACGGIHYIYTTYFRPKIRPFHGISSKNNDTTPPFIPLLNYLPDSIFIKDLKGSYVFANRSFLNLLKKDNIKEISGKTDFDLYPYDIANKYSSEDQIILKGEKQILERIKRSNTENDIKFTTTRKYALKNKKGKTIGLIGICTDTTEQTLANESLKKKNEELEKERMLLRTLIDHMPDTIYIKDENCNFLDANKSIITITHCSSREDLVGKNDHDFFPKELADKFLEDDKYIIRSGKSIINKEEISINSKGNLQVRSTTKVPFFNESGKVIGLVGIGRDITRQKEVEEKLIEQAQSLQEVNVLLEERQEEINQQSDELATRNNMLESERNLLRTLIDNVPDFIYIKDRNSTFLSANFHMLKNFKLHSNNEILGKSDFDFYPEELARKYFNDEQKIITTNTPLIGIEETALDTEGNIISIITSKVPFKGPKGNIEGIVGIGKDITNIKETELKLQEQAEYLKEVNVLLEERQEEIQQQSEDLALQNQQLENERNLLRTLIDNLPDSIFIKDKHSRFILANKSLMTKLKVKSTLELENKTDFDFYPSNLAKKFFDLEQNIFSNKKPVINQEEERESKDGKNKYRVITKVPYFDDNNELLGLVGITKDITELKNYQNALEKQTKDLREVNQLLEERSREILKQSEWLEEQNSLIEKERNLLRALIDNMPDSIYIKDMEGRFITVNKRLLKMISFYSVEDVIGKTDFDLGWTKELAQEYYKDDILILKTGKGLINKEEIVKDEFGRNRFFSTTKVPFKDLNGKIAGIVGIGRDITKQKNNEKKLIEQANNLKEINELLEERQDKIQRQSEKLNKQANSLKKANTQLEELNATKNKFFSIIAHDLKNPFQAIFGFSELLMRNFEDFEEQQRFELLEMIKISSESAYNLLENLLQWARTQTNRIKYAPTNINLPEIIKQNIILSKGSAEKKNITLNGIYEANNIVYADINMVNLIIRNILSNAIKFTNDNGFITISCSDINKEESLVSIIDTGIGISDENIKKLFRIDEYFSTTGTAGENGTGLGLIICKEFIEKNGGTLKIDSKIGKGTTFSFTLPTIENKYITENNI